MGSELGWQHRCPRVVRNSHSLAENPLNDSKQTNVKSWGAPERACGSYVRHETSSRMGVPDANSAFDLARLCAGTVNLFTLAVTTPCKSPLQVVPVRRRPETTVSVPSSCSRDVVDPNVQGVFVNQSITTLTSTRGQRQLTSTRCMLSAADGRNPVTRAILQADRFGRCVSVRCRSLFVVRRSTRKPLGSA